MTTGTIMAYLLQSAILLAAGWAIYKVALSHIKMPAFNRAVILGIYIVSLCTPALISGFSNTGNINLQQNTSELSDQSTCYDADFTESTLITQSDNNNSGGGCDIHTPAHPANSIANDDKIAFDANCAGRIVCAGAIAGTATLLLYMLTGIISIMRLSLKSKRISIGRIKVILLNDGNISPFSIFNMMFMSHSDMNTDADMIIEHEMEHIRKMHSIDLLLSHGCTTAMWWNPAAWLLNRELRAVHEYQADDRVLNCGHKLKDYQLLLIKKAAGTRLQSVSSSLNQSKLKKRFTMMYQKNPSGWAKLRAATLIPAFLLAVMLTGQTSFASILSEVSRISLLENDFEDAQHVTTESNNKVTNKYFALQHDEQEESAPVVATRSSDKNTVESVSVDDDKNSDDKKREFSTTIISTDDGEIVKINNITGDTIYHYTPNHVSPISPKDLEETFEKQKVTLEKQKQALEKQKQEFEKHKREFEKLSKLEYQQNINNGFYSTETKKYLKQHINAIKQQLESVKQQQKSVRKQFADIHGVDVKNLTDDMLTEHERTVLESLESAINSLESTIKSINSENSAVPGTNIDYSNMSGSKIITAKIINANTDGTNLRVLLTSNKPIKVESATLTVNGKQNKCSISTCINAHEQQNRLYKSIVDINTSRPNKTFTPDDTLILTTNLATITIKLN